MFFKDVMVFKEDHKVSLKARPLFDELRTLGLIAVGVLLRTLSEDTCLRPDGKNF